MDKYQSHPSLTFIIKTIFLRKTVDYTALSSICVIKETSIKTCNINIQLMPEPYICSILRFLVGKLNSFKVTFTN